MMKKVPFPSYTREVHERLTKKNEEKMKKVLFYSFLSVFDRFQPCECVRWSKYTTSMYSVKNIHTKSVHKSKRRDRATQKQKNPIQQS